MKILFITSHFNKDHGQAPFVKREFDAIKNTGLDIDLFSYKGSWSIINYIKIYFTLKKILKNNRYDLLHARFGQCGLLAILFFRHKSIVTFGGSDLQGSITLPRLKNFLLTRISRIVSSLCNYVIIVSHSMVRFIQNDNYAIIPSGVDVELFKPLDYLASRKKLSLSINKKYILFVGNPKNKIKRFDLAREVIDKLKKLNKTESFELLLVNNVKPSEVPLYMNSADCMILTSYNEGSPNTIKEALACELPIISVDVGDVSEHILKFKECMLSSNYNSLELAKLVNEVIFNANRVENGYDYIKNNLSLSIMSRDIIDVYDKCLKQ